MVPTNDASPLSDVFRCVRGIFAEISDTTTIQVGKQYLPEFGIGSPPRILFVPDPKGKEGDPPTGTGGVGYIGGVTHVCDVYVRAAESGDDDGRLDGAYALATRVRNALERAARGRIGWLDFRDSSPTGIDAWGADIARTFTYWRGEQRDPAIWSLKSNPIAKSPPDIGRPTGTPVSTVLTLDVDMDVQPIT